ncbi:MAG TPA: PKD domain-containing protein [Cyclobacteriaceae bacterium]|nr:PKD domain-containing protein [Cyclobacteriaceae bacterium]
MRLIFTTLFSLLIIVLVSCYHEEEIPVQVDISYAIPESFTAPVTIELQNKTTGADFYKWTFTGASPASSEKKQPGTITYTSAGEYKIVLEAWNDTQRSSKEITIRLDSAVTLDFDVAVLINDFAPATVKITNRTRGASTYSWSFQGGTPETSTLQDPPSVVFSDPGEHTISLQVSNGRETYASSRVITLKDKLNADFEIVPSFEDEDYEAPLHASLVNTTVSGLHYAWSSTGGTLTTTNTANSSIDFSAAGDYTVTLNADNDKETKSIDHTIHVKANTNLYTMSDVKLGVSAAHVTIGSFYSPSLRKVMTKNDVNTSNGNLIDLVFYGINSTFSYCRFVSPDSASVFTFPAIPQASHTYFVNTLETSTLSFSVSDFDNMVNDQPLTTLDIKGQDSGTAFFNNSIVPRIILFETDDGRKGAIKIKSFVSDGMQSYIMADIKIQKLKQ